MSDEKTGYQFTKGQAEAMEALLSGRNVFLSGNAGTGKSTGKKQVVLVGDFFQLPPVVTDADRPILMSWYPGNEEGYAFKSLLWQGMAFEPHVLTEVVRQSDPEFIGELNRARIGDRGCVDYFNARSVSDRHRAPAEDLWLCATNRMASTINEERVEELVKGGGKARTYTASTFGDVKQSDKATDDKLRLIEGARVMLLANMPDHGLSNGSLGTVVETGDGSVTVDFDDCPYEVEVEPKEWRVLKSTIRDTVGKDGRPTQELVTDTVGTFTQIPLRLAFAITIHKSQGQTFDRCAVHTKVFGAGMLYVALSRCTTFDGLTVWPKIERSRLYANQTVIDFYKSLEDAAAGIPQQAGLFDTVPTGQPVEQTVPDDGMVSVMCPAALRDKVQGYIDALMSVM